MPDSDNESNVGLFKIILTLGAVKGSASNDSCSVPQKFEPVIVINPDSVPAMTSTTGSFGSLKSCQPVGNCQWNESTSSVIELYVTTSPAHGVRLPTILKTDGNRSGPALLTI